MQSVVLAGVVCGLAANGVLGAQLTMADARVIALEISVPDDSRGGLIAADVNDDGRIDILVSAPGYVAAYDTNGTRLWSKHVDVRVGGSAEREGLPGHHGPGLQVADIDGDGHAEVLFLTQDSVVHIVAGATGEEKWSVSPPVPDGAQRWEHLVVANFSGNGDSDLLLQATNKEGYRMGRYVSAYRLGELQAGNTQPLWQTDGFLSCAHNGARLADIDGDGKDEVLGGTILGPDGRLLCKIPVRGHLDSIYAADVQPDSPGLEVVALEEGGGNRVFLANATEVLFITDYKGQEPQNAAVGKFDLSTAGLQVWCRSRYNEHQKPFVFDQQGQVLAHYEMDDVAPAGWTVSGVEVINAIHWTGAEKQLAAAKERHKDGDVCVFDPISGEFVLRIVERASRLYVADVIGDWREEIVVWNNDELHIYENPAPNPRAEQPRLWESQQYRRSKTTWNYYSP
jgi:outer membrane protein assembly factor BamB